MKVPRFKKVLCCLPLRRGCILLVYLNLIIACLAVIAFGLMDFMKLFIRMFTSNSYEMAHRAYRSKIHYYVLMPLFLTYILSELAMLVVSLIGLHKKNLNLIKVYLYYNVLVTSFMFFCRMVDINPFHWFMDLMVAAVYLLFKLYFILLIRSLVKRNLERIKEIPEVASEELELGMPKEENSQ